MLLKYKQIVQAHRSNFEPQNAHTPSLEMHIPLACIFRCFESFYAAEK